MSQPASEIKIRADTKEAKEQTSALAAEIKGKLQPVVDVVGAVRAGYDLLTGAVARARGAIAEIVQVASVQEAAERKLVSALELQGQARGDVIAGIMAENAARQQATGVGDEVQLQLQASALAMGVEARAIGKVTDATIALSNITGQGLNEAVKIVTKAYLGNVQALKEYGIQVSTEQEALDLLQGKLGLVTDRTNTFAGSVDLLKANFGDMLEELGNAIIKNDAVKEAIKDLNEEVLGLAKTAKENGPEMRSAIADVVHEVRAFIDWTRDNKGSIETALGLIGALWGASKVPGIAANLGKLGGGVASIAGAAGSAGSAAVSAAGGALGGLGTVGLGITAGAGGLLGLLGSLLVLPDTNTAGVAAALEQQLRGGESRSAADLAMLQTNGPFYPPGTQPSGGVNFDVPTRVTVSTEQLAADIKAAKEAEEKELREFNAAEKKMLDDEAQTFKEYSDNLENLRVGEINARGVARQRELAIEDERIRAEDERITTLNRLAIAGLDASKYSEDERYLIAKNGFDTMQDLHRAQIAEAQQFNADITKVGLDGINSFITGTVTAWASGKSSLEDAALSAFGAMLGQMGQGLFSLGSAAVAAGILGSVAPIFAPATGGPAGIAAGLGLMGAGAVLMGIGSFATARTGPASAGAGASSAPRASSNVTRTGVAGGFSGAAANGGAPVTNITLVLTKGFMRGTPRELGRELKGLINGADSLQAGWAA